MVETDLLGGAVVIVSGKGGTGKTTVAAALAMAAVRAGKRVLLTDVEGREGPSALLGLIPPGFKERPTPFGFSMLSITPREALVEYLRLFFHMRTLSRTLARGRVVETATDGIPGFRDLMVAGKLYELSTWRTGSTEREARERPQYDLVVVDAPPTGQLLPLLSAAPTFRDIIKGGRPHRQLAAIDRLIRRQSRIALVAVPEEMAVVETVETAGALEQGGFPRPVVVANRVRPPVFPRGTRAAGLRLSPEKMEPALARADIQATPLVATDLLDGALAEDAAVQAERRWLGRLKDAGPLVELPLIASDRFGPEQVAELAGPLAP